MGWLKELVVMPVSVPAAKFAARSPMLPFLGGVMKQRFEGPSYMQATPWVSRADCLLQDVDG